MYFGNTSAQATEQFVYELVANVADCYLSGTATFVSVSIESGKITVMDDGPGLPFDIPSDLLGVSLATQFLTDLHFTGSNDGHAPHVHVRHFHGVGLAVLNFTSSQLKIQSWRTGVLWEQEFCQGVPLTPPQIIEPDTNILSTQCGTKIEITPDPEIFQGSQPRSNIVRWYLFETAHLVKGIEIRFQQERFYAPQGLVQLLPFLQPDRSEPFSPSLASDLPFQLTVEIEHISIDAVAQGITQQSTKIYSWVNGGMMSQGGSHVDGFRQALLDVNWQPELVMIQVVIGEPAFAGPMKAKLAVPKVAQIVQDAVIEPLRQHLLLLRPPDSASSKTIES